MQDMQVMQHYAGCHRSAGRGTAKNAKSAKETQNRLAIFASLAVSSLPLISELKTENRKLKTSNA